MSTIFAQATAAGRAGVAVIRLSGPDALSVGTDLVGALPEPRQTGLRTIRDADGQVIDQALVIVFRGPASFTGEDVVEFHVHGSIAVVRAVLRLLGEIPGCRQAEAGEFTRRALENDRLDLAQVEGLADLIEAETDLQRRQAMKVFSGHLGERVEGWRRDLIRAGALLEATIDFADEEVPVDVTPEVSLLLSGVIGELRREIDGSLVAERVRHGFEVAIVGPPNVGKSTLLNRLAGREAAITSEVAGTTRDIIEVQMDLDGLPVTMLDTAGLRESEGIEAIGVERAVARAAAADLRVFLTDDVDQLPITPGADDITLLPKIDLVDGSANGVSGKTGQGVSELLDQITSILAVRTQGVGVATHERHRTAIQRAEAQILLAQQMVERGAETYDIAAEELRLGVRALEEMTGCIGVENLLDEIFSSFCIGK